MNIPTRKNALVKSVDEVATQVWGTNSSFGANQIMVDWLLSNDPFCRHGYPISSVQEEDGVRTYRLR